MVRRISGKYEANTVSHLKYNDNDITDVKEICNTLAAQFAFNSSYYDNYSHVFNRPRLTIERKTIDFDTIDHFPYNDVFTLHELKHVILSITQALPEDSLLLLLYIFNHIWLTQDFPTPWKTAIVIPVSKPGKVLTDPGCYWPIALTSCLCKTMERMVNSRLTWYLERHMIINEYQSGFRRRRSTVDNLVTLETSIRDAFVGIKHHSGFHLFYLETAYDTTWKHGILLELYKTLSHYLVSRLIVLYLVYCLILNVPFM